ncbi:hypothetical protein BKA80DRAFT_108988 [Phyllosticta citrichinensis]
MAAGAGKIRMELGAVMTCRTPTSNGDWERGHVMTGCGSASCALSVSGWGGVGLGWLDGMMVMEIQCKCWRRCRSGDEMDKRCVVCDSRVRQVDQHAAMKASCERPTVEGQDDPGRLGELSASKGPATTGEDPGRTGGYEFWQDVVLVCESRC